MFDNIISRQPMGLAGRLLSLIGLGDRGASKCTAIEPDRFAALDDPATRKALSDLPPHLLRDIGVSATAAALEEVEGSALRKYLW